MKGFQHSWAQNRNIAHLIPLSRISEQTGLSLTDSGGNPEELCRWHGDFNRKCEYGIEPFLGFITECVNDGKSPSETHRVNFGTASPSARGNRFFRKWQYANTQEYGKIEG